MVLVKIREEKVDFFPGEENDNFLVAVKVVVLEKISNVNISPPVKINEVNDLKI